LAGANVPGNEWPRVRYHAEVLEEIIMFGIHASIPPNGVQFYSLQGVTTNNNQTNSVPLWNNGGGGYIVRMWIQNALQNLTVVDQADKESFLDAIVRADSYKKMRDCMRQFSTDCRNASTQ